jgi:hypothetical protein
VEHETWCTSHHDDATGCASEPLDTGPIAVWLHQTPTGPAVAIDAAPGASLSIGAWLDLCTAGIALAARARPVVVRQAGPCAEAAATA